jgi:hypothetical protein
MFGGREGRCTPQGPWRVKPAPRTDPPENDYGVAGLPGRRRFHTSVGAVCEVLVDYRLIPSIRFLAHFEWCRELLLLNETMDVLPGERDALALQILENEDLHGVAPSFVVTERHL